MSLKTKTGLFSMESFHTKTPVSTMAAGFCACSCGCGCVTCCARTCGGGCLDVLFCFGGCAGTCAG